MTTFDVDQVVRGGIEPTFETATETGDAFLNDGKVWIHVINGAGELVLTIITQQTIDGEAVDDKTVTIDASTTQVIGPFPTEIYNDGDGLVQLTYSKHEEVTIAFLKY
jgi:hypothetical protein